MKNKKIIIISIAVVAVAIILAVIFMPKSTSGKTINLYVSDTCPHCKIVEEYIESNDIDKKVEFDIKEVTGSISNARELMDRANTCGINQNEVGVPLLWDGSKCLVGDVDIISFFKDKAGLNQ